MAKGPVRWTGPFAMPVRSVRSVRSGAALGRRLLAARLAQERQPLLEQLLELGDGAALQKHVPVGADVLGLLGGRLRSVEELRLVAATALPHRGHVGLNAERQL